MHFCFVFAVKYNVQHEFNKVPARILCLLSHIFTGWLKGVVKVISETNYDIATCVTHEFWAAYFICNEVVKLCNVICFLHIYVPPLLKEKHGSTKNSLFFTVEQFYKASPIVYLMVCSSQNQSEPSRFYKQSPPHHLDENFHVTVFINVWGLLICFFIYCWSAAINLVIVSGLNRSFWSCKSNNYWYPCAGPLWNILLVNFFVMS